MHLAVRAPSRNSSLTPVQKRRAEQLTSIFENDTPELQYDYVEDIGDGRGYTAGRAGFCTGTADAVQVIRHYNSIRPGNSLQKYMDELEALEAAFLETEEPQGDTSGLDAVGSYADDWRESAGDPAFRAAQDLVVDRLYFLPAMEHVSRLGLATALSKAVFYDTIIQHGEEGDASLTDLIERTNEALGVGSPVEVGEDVWLRQFLDQRFEVLDGTDVWHESRGRVEQLRELLDDGNFDLQGPITTIPTVSGYTVYTLP
jgi:chitosanase